MNNRPVGLPNIGTTCYANSILQILASIEFLTIPKILPRKEGVPNSKYVLAGNIYELIRQIRQRKVEHNTIIQAFIAMARCNPSFAQGQQDQNEYLNYVLSVLHDCSSTRSIMNIELPNRRLTKKEELEVSGYHSMRIDGTAVVGTQIVGPTNNFMLKSSIFLYFTGQTLTQTCCTSCGHISNVFDIFRSWNISMPPEARTLDDCMSHYTATTQLGSDEKNMCTKCNVYNPSYVTRKLWNCPTILIISLGRFAHNNEGNTYKNTNPIRIPEYLDVGRYSSSPEISCPYRLVAIAHHIGEINCGHCYCTIKVNDAWYEIDDNAVTAVANYCAQHAYICFYQRIAS
jgi:ubiquitin C-terminal hydrolase